MKPPDSEIINNYLDLDLKKIVSAWFQIDVRTEKLIRENLSAPLTNFLYRNYDCSKETDVYANITKHLHFFLKWYHQFRQHV